MGYCLSFSSFTREIILKIDIEIQKVNKYKLTYQLNNYNRYG